MAEVHVSKSEVMAVYNRLGCSVGQARVIAACLKTGMSAHDAQRYPMLNNPRVEPDGSGGATVHM